MKKHLEDMMAVIFLILLTMFLSMALTARCESAMDTVQQQIKEESMIF